MIAASPPYAGTDGARIGALLAFVGTGLALWLVREREIERDQRELVRAEEEAAAFLAISA